MRKLVSAVVVISILTLVSAVGAQAAPITLGSPLTGTFTTSTCSSPCTLFNAEVSGPNPVASPVDGVIVRWRVTGASAVPGYEIRVLQPVGSVEYAAVGTSAPETPSGPTQQSFAADLPIKAGELVGIDTPDGGALPINHAGGQYGGWEPPLVEGHAQTPIGSVVGELGYNAEVLPAPTITSLGTTSGPTAGGTSVTIAGTDFTEVKGVSFGSTPVPFLVNSEGQITATSPAGTAGSIPVTVTTIAGAATASQQFTYTAPAPGPTPSTAPAPTCKVPKLKGKKLNAAKKAVVAAHCKLGKVTKKKGVTAETGKVVKQGAKAGTVKTAGSKISVKLG